MIKNIFTKNKKGAMLIQVIIFSGIIIFTTGGLINWMSGNLTLSRKTYNRELALQIAEAGIDYYRWRLAHSPTDYQTNPGPLVEDHRDKNGNLLGQFTLEITPPAIGSTIVTVRSTGTISGDQSISRTLIVKYAKPSIAKYAVAANDNMRFGEGTIVFGSIHSNKGIRFDGVIHNTITSSLAKYDDPDHSGGQEFGVHTHVYPTDPLPPAQVPVRADVFVAGRDFPVPEIDFPGITADLAEMKQSAVNGGFYRTSSGYKGYEIVLKTNDTFDLYRVRNFISIPSWCTNEQDQDGWDTWSVRQRTNLGNFAFPSNGIMFFEDNIFVKGQINSARLTIIAAYLPDSPSTRKSITINSDLLYTNYDGTDSIGLIAQKNINIGMVSEDDLRIDGALIAQNGRVGRYYYGSYCDSYDERDTITLWGMIATNERYGFAYTDDTGYETRNINYDGNLLYAPPPNFPLTSDNFIIISREEE